MRKRALITGITGQDGSYLAELLLEKDYEVCGMVRRASYHNTQRIDHLIGHPQLHLLGGDMSDSSSIMRILSEAKPDEIYNLAAQSHVKRTARLFESAGRHFNRGQRALFFALGYLGWFAGPYALMVATVATVAVMWRRQFASESRRALVDD